MKKITFYYARHGFTEYNKAGITQGQVDSPLCPEGIPVLQETGRILRDIPFAKCFSSPFQRAVSTAEIILEGRDVPIIPIDDLKEISFGDLDGRPHAERPKILRFCILLDNFRPVHGESARDVRKRVRRAFEYMTENCSDGDHVLITCHGSYYQYVLFELLGKNRLSLKMDKAFRGTANGAVSVFTYEDGKFHLQCYPLTGEKLQSFLQNASSQAGA